MKKLSFKNLVIGFMFLLTMASVVSIFINQKNTKAESTLPSYYLVELQDYSENAYITTNSTNSLEDNTAILLSRNNKSRVVLSLGRITEGNDYSTKIRNLIWKVVVNDDTTFESDSAAFRNAGFELSINSETSVFELIISPYSSDGTYNSNFIYGKYNIEFSYYYTDNDNVYTTFSNTFYILDESNYINSEKYNNFTSNSGTIYYSNYNTDGLPYIEYNHKYVNVKIEKDYQGLTYTTNVINSNGTLNISSLNEKGEASSENYVIVKSLDNNGKTQIIFKDLGSYYITYERINARGNNEVITKYFNDSKPTQNSKVVVFGYQAFYTTGSSLEEFKLLNSEEPFKVQQSADVSSRYKISENKLVKIDDFDLSTDDYNNLKNSIVKTNQAPVYFMTNSKLAKQESAIKSNYYYLDSLNNLSGSLESYKVSNYSGTPIEKEGYYITELVYTFDGIDGEFTQYFIFQITHESPVITIETDEESPLEISTNDSTNKSVAISKSELGAFDTTSTLTVFIDTTFTGNNYNKVQIVTDETIFTQSGKYKVELTYGNSNKKGYNSYFTIDKTGITGISIYNANSLGGNLYEKGKIVSGYVTNQSIALEWNNKISCGTYAEYKFIPTQYSSEYIQSLTDNELVTLYNSNGGKCMAIPSSYVLNSSAYDVKPIPVSTYSNVSGISTLTENNIISESGLYIFRIYDETGAEVYRPLFIDKTTNNILVYNNSQYKIAGNDEMTSKDTILFFGKSKYIKFTETAIADEWFLKCISETDFTDFSKYIVEYKGERYFSIAINPTVYYSTNSSLQSTYALSDSNGYKIELSSMLGNIPNENQYVFYSICESTQDSSNYSQGTFNYYEENATCEYSITFTTDNSNMSLTYVNDDGKISRLKQSAVETSTIGGVDAKTNFFEPTAQNTLSSADVLTFTYCISPSDEIKVQEIVLKYYPFTESSENSTYIFNEKELSTTKIYQKDSFNNGSLIDSVTNMYEYLVALETYEGNKQRTKAGKYVITRTYTDASDAYLDENDPKIRELVFIVDRNGIISSPKVSQNGDSIYYTGSAIRLQVVNSFETAGNSDSLFFYDIYFASKLNSSSGTFTPVLTTNLLPVTLYVPQYKYGYDILGIDGKITPYFNQENSILQYGNNKNTYSNYQLSAVVDYYEESNLINVAETYLFNKVTNENYLTTSSNNSVISFNKVGYYKVTIMSKAGDSFTFVFQIKEAQPEYSITNVDNTTINTDGNGVYYTNQSKVRVSWEDAQSEFLATINQEEISYTVNGFEGTIDTTKTPINKNGDYGYYFDLDLESIGAYEDGAEVTITLQFKGVASDYLDLKNFSKTTTIKVDLQAPLANINRLIATTGLSFTDLREYASGNGNKFNISKTSGILQYYAYTIDKTNISTLLLNPTETNEDFYKAYYKVRVNGEVNTKYVAGFDKELDILSGDPSSSATGKLFENPDLTFATLCDESLNYYNKYIDIVEEDYAGNRTVYTILIKDYQSELEQQIITYYKSSTNTDANGGELLQNLTFNDLSQKIDLYSKYKFSVESVDFINNFNLMDLTWQIITINGKFYVKNPYSEGKYYSLEEYNSTGESELYALSEISALGPSANSQLIELYSVPYFGKVSLNIYVLNKALEVYSLAQVYQNNELEGIAIKLPTTQAGEDNTLYATNLLVKGNVGGSALYEFNLTDYISDEYLRKEIEALPKIEGYEIYYVTYRGDRYFVLEIVNQNLRENDYFIYTYVDNFGEQYSPLIHIYGQQEINEPIISDGEIVETYDESGKLIYYSSENITYKFDSTVYNSAKIVLIIDSTSITYNLTKSKNNLILTKGDSSESILADDNGVYDGHLKLKIVNNVIFVTMLAKEYNFDNKETGYGGDYRYEITLNPNVDFKIDSQSIFFEIYNQIPTIILLSKNGDDVSIVFGNQYYLDSITVNYSRTSLKFPYELLLIDNQGNLSTLENNQTFNEDGVYKIIINYLGDIKGCSKTLEFTIASSSNFKYNVVKHLENGMYEQVNLTGAPFTYVEGGATKTVANHYIVNGEYDIRTNANLNIRYEAIDSTDKNPIDGYTYLYRIYNTSDDLGLVTELYSTVIAITRVPESSNILTKFAQYDNMGRAEDILNTSSITSHVITKEEYDAGKKIYWSKYSVIPENKINVEIFYGDTDGEGYYPVIEEINDTYCLTLKTSGVYYVKFYDMAGNVHLFGSYSDNEFYIIKYVSSVIFEVEGESPINYAIYDHEVMVSIPETTLSYYDSNAMPEIKVELNGIEYKDYEKISNNSWKFKSAGLYKIIFSAKIDEESVYESPLYFTILSKNETRLSYSYNGYGDYYIQDILLDGQSVYERLANINNGDMYEGKYLKNINLHYYDARTGKGTWTFVIYTNNEFKQTFEFSIWINRAEVPLIISVESGQSTTSEITIKFNTKNMLAEVGDCILKITNFNDFYITQERLDNGELKETYTITLTEAGDYYIETTSLSGQLLSSAFVTKTEPLNTVSIILIVVGVLVLVSGVIVFVLLRKRMKVR